MPINLAYYQRLQEEEVLKKISRDDLIIKLRQELGLECPKHTKKEYIIKVILDTKYGKEEK